MVSLFGLQRCLQFTATEVLGTQHLIDWDWKASFLSGRLWLAWFKHGNESESFSGLSFVQDQKVWSLIGWIHLD